MHYLVSWPCLHQWLEIRRTRQVCPVCKAAISKEKVVPLYGRGATKQEDPRFEKYSIFNFITISYHILITIFNAEIIHLHVQWVKDLSMKLM